jgi:hypothetical protein
VTTAHPPACAAGRPRKEDASRSVTCDTSSLPASSHELLESTALGRLSTLLFDSPGLAGPLHKPLAVWQAVYALTVVARAKLFPRHDARELSAEYEAVQLVAAEHITATCLERSLRRLLELRAQGGALTREDRQIALNMVLWLRHRAADFLETEHPREDGGSWQELVDQVAAVW